jgi:hypothetical protein
MSSELTEGNEGHDGSHEIIEHSCDVVMAGVGVAGSRAALGMAAPDCEQRASPGVSATRNRDRRRAAFVHVATPTVSLRPSPRLRVNLPRQLFGWLVSD